MIGLALVYAYIAANVAVAVIVGHVEHGGDLAAWWRS